MMHEELFNDDVVATQVVTQQEGLIDSAKEYLDPRNWAAKFNISKQRMIEMSVYFVLGFALGFLMKKYSKFLSAAIITLACVGLLHYLGFVTIVINMSRIESTFGIAMPPFQSGAMAHYWEWITVNIALVVSLAIGFVIGMKVA